MLEWPILCHVRFRVLWDQATHGLWSLPNGLAYIRVDRARHQRINGNFITATNNFPIKAHLLILKKRSRKDNLNSLPFLPWKLHHLHTPTKRNLPSVRVLLESFHYCLSLLVFNLDPNIQLSHQRSVARILDPSVNFFASSAAKWERMPNQPFCKPTYHHVIRSLILPKTDWHHPWGFSGGQWLWAMWRGVGPRVKKILWSIRLRCTRVNLYEAFGVQGTFEGL